ncbi:thioesterase family protein [Mycobacterium sp. MYCO198283]|uniref:acyl-CoA thioesterase domain-containing protein n=1 Tax=Mycobacterium sp. MYCO198283 TaxID=2883505 RepID=UPI001E3C1A92|nr:acyl-CoA thioesterase domain-containing protein [Mycobacterium sp. MYCO198283]MCG5433364.1 thioesterase family protein [Mycobacterium sp. MYCO198283]
MTATGPEPMSTFRRGPDGRFLPTRLAQSHWGDDHLNGPAIVGLAATVLEQRYGDPAFQPARLTVDLFKAARGVPTATELRTVRDGRRVRVADCDVVQGGAVVARATLVQYRRSAPPRGEEWCTAAEFERPQVDDAPWPYVSSGDGGWTRSPGDHQNTARKRFYNKPVPVLDGEEPSAFVRAAVVAESTSLVTNLGTAGVGYINGDLTVALVRLPVGRWVGVQADAHWTADGIAVGTATLFDDRGPFGSGTITAVSNPDAQIDFSGQDLLRPPRR